MRAVFRGGLAVIALGSIVITFLLTIQHQGDFLWGVPDQAKQNYRTLQKRADAFFHASRGK